MLFLLQHAFYYIIHSNFYMLRSPSILNAYSLLLLIYNSTYVSCILLNPDLPLTCLSISILEFPSRFEMQIFIFTSHDLYHFPTFPPNSSTEFLTNYPSITP